MLSHQQSQISMGDFIHQATVVVMQGAAVLCHPDASHPLMHLLLSVNTQVPDVLGILGLDLRVLDSKAMVCWSFEFPLPTHTVINLVDVKRTKAQ